MIKDPRQAFYSHNRAKLRSELSKNSDYQGLMIITGHSTMQASADNTLPFVQDSSFFYLTGLEESNLMLVLDGNEEYLVVPDFDEVQAAFEGEINRENLRAISGLATIFTQSDAWIKLSDRIKTIEHVAILQPIDSYIERHDMFANPSRQRLVDRILAQNSATTFIDIRPIVSKMRMIKTDYEIQQIEKAIALTKTLFEVIENKRTTATNERELFAAITHKRIMLGEVDAYEPIIAGGAHAVTLHYVKNNAPLAQSKLLLLDIGLKHNGYSADITRTVVSNPTKRQKDVYDAVLDIHSYALGFCKPGMTFKEYETSIRNYMGTKLQSLGLITEVTDEAIRKYYPHSTSHFLGIDVHDVGDYTEPFAAGLVITVEPGIYIGEEGIGIRLEDDILITDDGYRNLSIDLPKNITSLTINN